jgi:zinc protease
MKKLIALSLLSILCAGTVSRSHAAESPAAPTAPTASAADSNIHLPVPEVETLPNGLQLVWFLSDSLPVIDIGLMIKSGYRDDPKGRSGTSELLSAVLDRGNAGMNAQALAKAVEALGASRYSSADEDTFAVGIHGLAPDAPALLDLVAKIALKPEFPESEVTREHARILDRWKHIPDYGETLASVAFSRLIAGGSTYGRGSFASVDEFKKVGREDVLAFYKKNFTPKNSILMVVGRVDKKSFRDRILKAFGDWQGDSPKHEYVSYLDPRLKAKLGARASSRSREEVIVVDRPELTQAQVRIGFRAAPLQAPEHYALVVGNALTGEYFNSRLNSLIRDKLGLTYSIGSSFSYSKDFATFDVVSATRNESVGQLLRRTLDVLRGIKTGPIPQDEVTMAKEYLIGGFPLSTATLGAVASRWLAGVVMNLGPEYLNEFVPKVRAITTQEVVSAMAKDLDLDHLVIVVAGDSRAIEKSLQDADFHGYKKLRAEDLL